MARDSCLARITAGTAIGGAVGGAVGAVYGTYEAIRYKDSEFTERSLNILQRGYNGYPHSEIFNFLVPGLLKIRHIGQTTIGSAAIFGLFLGAGSLIHCGKSY